MPRAKQPPSTNTAEFEALAKVLNFSVLLLDRETNLKFASADAHLLFGSNDADDLKRGWRDYFDRLKLPDLLQLEKNNKPLRHRAEFPTLKSTQMLRMEIYPLRHDDCECYVMFLKDRQELDGLEQQLMLASQHDVQRYLTSTLVHDLNAPINTMRITLELIERTMAAAGLDASSDFATKWERYRNIFREELGKLKTQVADIPNLFNSAKEATPAAFDIRNVIEDVAKFLKHETASKQIRRELQLPEYPITIHGRVRELRLALLNLATSLVEATRQGGRLHLRASANEDFAEIVLVADEAQLNPQSVENYEQLAFAPKGSSAAIFVARLIVEAHGGDIHVDIPSEGNNVTVRLLLPLAVPNNG